MADPLRVLSLCAGIGGLELGVGRAVRTRVVGYVERDPFAASVLMARMEDEALDPAPVWCGDLACLDARPLRGHVELVTAGYPCQPFSVAGKRRGEHDPRHLWPHVARALEETGAPLAFLENVGGHVRLGLADVLADLAVLGFDAEWGLLRASDVGAPHRRERLFILAYRDGDALRELSRRSGGASRTGPSLAGLAGEELAHGHGHGREGERRGGLLDGERTARGNDADGCGGAELAYSADGSSRGAGIGREAPDDPISVGHPSSPRLEVGRPEPEPRPFPAPWPPGPEGDWSGVPWWLQPAVQSVLVDPPVSVQQALSRRARGAGEPSPPQPAFRGVADGLPPGVDPDRGRSDRLRCLGNAVVPAQAERAFLELARRGGLTE